jgi:acetylornithine deacetylase/succinyl-diaminopimelate desuccinylase-like protein
VSALNPETVQNLRGVVENLFPALQDDLEALVRIPSVSAPAFDPANVVASSYAVAALAGATLRKFSAVAGEGPDTIDVQILRAPKHDGTLGAPAVVARRPAPEGAPTILLYAHHDVQPPGDGWDHSPFEPNQDGDRLFGRGAADDKAGICAHLGALRALTDLGEIPHVGVTIFCEGEEEDGSPSFRNFLEQNTELLHADVMIVADSVNWKVGTPALTTSLRGLVDGVLEVEALDHAIHSGMFGGPILDAYTIAARIIASLHDADGNVAIEGLVSGPEPTVDYSEAQFREESGIPDHVHLAGSGSIAGRMWTKPSMCVVGIDAVPVDEAINVLTPRVRVKLSLRLAPGQEPEAAAQALEEHIMANTPFGARSTWTTYEYGKPFKAPSDTTAMQMARQCFAAAWDNDPVDIGVGGSIPFIADLLEVFPDSKILVTGVEDPDSRAHGANESVHLGELRKVIVAEALMLRTLAA